MKKNIFIVSWIFCFVISAFSQRDQIAVVEAVKVKNEKHAEALFFYENNWKALREIAVEKGFISSFELIEIKADQEADFDFILITRFANRLQVEKAEENFQEIIKRFGGLKLLNDLEPIDFRENAFLKIGKVGTTGSDMKSSDSKSECPSEEIKVFDFLLGNWKQKGTNGKMRITKILNQCGIQEEWKLDEFSAVLLRTYDTKSKKWYLSFAAHDLVPQVWEGRFENGNWIFYRDWELNGKARKSRTFWKKTSGGGFEKIVEQLNEDGETWRVHADEKFERDDGS